MSMRTILLLACLAGATGTDVKHFGSVAYVEKTACDKQQDLWDAVSADAERFPGAGGIFVQPVDPAFAFITKPDALPVDPALPPWASLGTTRVGTVGRIKFKATADSEYTGCFKGADHGLIRFSAALEPSNSTFLAGFGLKFLRSGTDSANLVAMYGAEGNSSDTNFFSNEFSTIISPALITSMNALSPKFPAAKDYITSVGLSDLASKDQKGHEENEASVKFPFSLRFKAHASVATDAGQNYVDGLLNLKLPADAILFDVYAMDKPTKLDGKESLIGTVQLDGNLVTSTFGDTNLFFSHQEADADIKFHPDWKDYYDGTSRRLHQTLTLADDIIV